MFTPPTLPTSACIQTASEIYRVPEWALKNRLRYPAGYVLYRGKKRVRIGPAGLPWATGKRLVAAGVSEHALQNNGCINILASAWDLAQNSATPPAWKPLQQVSGAVATAASQTTVNWPRINQWLRATHVALHTQCVVAAAQYYRLPLPIFYGILETEGGQVGETVADSNGSYDIGPAQVNSIHLPMLAHYGIDEYRLQWNGCLNVFVGASILASAIDGANPADPLAFWRHVGDYNSDTPYYNRQYRARVYRQVMRYFPGDIR